MRCPKCNREIHSLDWSVDGIINIRLIQKPGYFYRYIKSAIPHNELGDFTCPKCHEFLFKNLKEAKKALLKE